MIPLLALLTLYSTGPEANLQTKRPSPLERVFGRSRVGVFQNGQLDHVALLSRGYDPETRPGSRERSVVRPSKDWELRFRTALLNTNNHLWLVWYHLISDADVSVQYRTKSDCLDIRFYFGSSEIEFWSDEDGRSHRQSIQPGQSPFLKLIRELFPDDSALKAFPLKPDLSKVMSRNFDPDDPEPSSRKQGLEGIFGKESIENVRKADLLEIFRIHRDKVGDPVKPPAEFLSEFKKIFFRKDNHLWGPVSRCGFDPRIGLRFYRGSKVETLLFCFTCDDIQFAQTSRDEERPKNSILPGRAAFLTLFKKVFLEDKEIQALPLLGQ